jgi:competence protein ComEC
VLLLVTHLSQAAAASKAPDAVITFIDVGEGDSILIESGGHAALIDAGNPIAGSPVIRLLRSRKIEYLDRVIITHPHPDHFGGMFQILQNFGSGDVHDNGEDIEPFMAKDPVLRWYDELVRKGARYSPLVRGQSFVLGDVTLDVLSPAKPMESRDWNANSVILRASVCGVKILLMADGNTETERLLMDKGIDLSAAVLKVGHHGAIDAGSPEFLERVKPRVTVVSVNKDNYNGFPAPATIERLASASKVYRTDESGNIALAIYSDGQYDISTGRALSR